MKPPDPLTAATSTALMAGALDRLRAQHSAPTPPPIPKPAPPVEVEIPDWLADDPTLPIPQRVGRTQLRIALAHGRVTLAELEAQRPAIEVEPAPPTLAERMRRLLSEVDPVVTFGLMPDDRAKVADMIAAGASWLDAARAIGWCEQTLREHFEVEPTPPPTDGEPLAEGSAWLQGAGLLAQLQPGAAPLNPSTGAGAALLRALERDGDLVLRRLRHALTEPSEGALRESIAAGDVSLGALVPAKPSATTRRLDDGAARPAPPVLRVLAGGRRG